MARKSFDFKFNLILVGDSDVGKTKILTRFGLDVGGLPDFSTGMPDFNTKTVLVQKKLIELKLWNTEGQEKFRSINADLYRRAMGFMLVYDITSRSSFDNISMWLREIEEERAPTEIERILLGNRCEMCDRRKVSKEEGERFAREHSIPFLETSTENNLNIEQAFMTLTENILKKVMSVSPLSLPVSSPVGQSTKATSEAAATGRSGSSSVAKRMGTSSIIQKLFSFRKSETKRDKELVESLIQQIEQLQSDVVARDREMAEIRKQKENEAADVEQMRQQNRDLETALRVEKVERENAVSEERRRGEERLQVDKLNIQRQLDESRVQNEALQRSLNDLQVQKSNTEELLSDAEATIERYKEREQTEVLRIASNDIQLTDTKLGGGSYGEVRIGYWRDCPVAVKIMYKDLISSPFYIRLLQQEVSVAWKIHHPNIATVCGVTLELDEEEKKAWIIMELMSGSMSCVIYACKGEILPLTLREMVDMAHDSLCGLDYLHSMQPKAILHGDICPRDILVTSTMRAKLGDLGGARFYDASLSVGMLSPHYTAPERLEGRAVHKNDKTDMYSMGVTICELFTADPPNSLRRIDQVQHVRQREVRSLCKHMLKDDPATRPTAAEARNIFSRIRETDEYVSCPPRRSVKGKMDGGKEVTLAHPIW